MTGLRLTQNVSSIVTLVIYFAASYNTFAVSLSAMVFLKWTCVLYYLQALPRVGPVVQMIVSIFYDILDVLLVFLISMLAMANSVYTLARHEEGYTDFADAMYTTYKALILVEFEDSSYPRIFNLYLKIIYIITSLLASVVVLNLLIARMSDSYERIQEVARMEERRLRAKIITRYETVMSSTQCSRSEWFPSFLHAQVKKGGNQAKLRPTEWAGVLSEMKGKVDALETKMNTALKDMHAGVEAQNRAAEKRAQELDKKLDAILRAISTPEREESEDISGF
eukprot:m.116688 g.116688  ORF g.116688 m.116688 type:complete len:281 (+) comp14240_c0_seq3:3182-4024(+)